MSDDFNLPFAIGKIAHASGELPCIIAHDIEINYAKFWQITCSFAAKMQQLGVSPDSFVMVRTRDLIASLATLHAVGLLGARYAAYDARVIDNDLDGLGEPDFLFYTPDEPDVPNLKTMCITPDWINPTPDAFKQLSFSGFRSPESPWLLVNTSGTTGMPKYLWLTARQVMLRTQASQDDFKFGTTRFCALFPCNTRPFFARANAALLSASVIVDTIDIAFLQHHHVDLFCGSPRTAVEWLAGRVISPKLPLIQVSGARLEPANLRILLQSFEIVEDVYGASETSKTHVNRIELIDGKIASHGRMLDSTLELIDQTGLRIDESGKPGLLRVSNPYINTNYIGSTSEANPHVGTGSFQSGDIAMWGPRRELMIVGRVDQLINLGGMKIDPGRVEEAIQTVEHVTGAVAMAIPRPIVPPRLMALVTLADTSKAETAINAIRSICEKALPSPAIPSLIFFVDDIPRTADGAPKRAECRELGDSVLKRAEQARQANP